MERISEKVLSMILAVILVSATLCIPAFAMATDFTSNSSSDVFSNEGLTYTTATNSDIEFGEFKTQLAQAEMAGNAAIINFEGLPELTWQDTTKFDPINLKYASGTKTIVMTHECINGLDNQTYNYFYIAANEAATSGNMVLRLPNGTGNAEHEVTLSQPTGEYIKAAGFSINKIKMSAAVTATFTNENGETVGKKTISYTPNGTEADITKPYFYSFKAPKGTYISKLRFNGDTGWPSVDDICFITGGLDYSTEAAASISISGSDRVSLSADGDVSATYKASVFDANGGLVSSEVSWSIVGDHGTTASILNGVLTLTKDFAESSVMIKATQGNAEATKVVNVEAAEPYLNSVRMEGSLTEYDMASFKADLEAADAKAIVTFEPETYTAAKTVLIPTNIYDQNHFGASATGGLSMPIAYKNGTEDETVRFNLYYSNMQAKNETNAAAWLEATKKIEEDSILSVSGTKYMNMWTKGCDTNLFFGYEKSNESNAATLQADYSNLKPSAMGFAMRHTNWSNSIVVKATITDGVTDETVTVLNLTSPTPDSKAKFVGIKAPEGKFIRYITFNTTNSLSIDDVCFALNERPAEYDKLIPSYENLEIYENNLTDYIPLDGYGSSDDVKIRWKSSDESVVTNTGKIYPKVGEEKTVTLTATLYIEGSDITLDKEFTVTIPAVKPYVIEGVKVTGADGLTDTELVADKEISKVSVKRYDTTNSKITVAVALYDADKNLEDVSFEVITPSVSAHAHGDITLTNPVKIPSGDITGYTAKAMIWSETGLVPLADSYSVVPFDNKVTVYMIGDSLSQSGGVSSYPYNGWGDTVGNHFLSENVTVDNSQSEGGVSTKTVVRDNKKLPYVEGKINEGDYIFVMLGHNDQTFGNGGNYKHTGVGEYNREIDGDNISYYGYLMHIVDVARENKANIVFFTPFNRAYDTLDNLRGMNLAMKAFANEQNLPVIDTTPLSLELYNKLLEKGTELKNEGKVSSAEDFARNIFLFVTKDDPRYPNMPTASPYYGKATADFTHFNIYGADLRAQLAVLALSNSDNALGRFENVASENYEALYSKAIADILATEYYGKIN